MASFKMIFDGVYGGPCPACGGHGLLLAHDGEFGGYRTIRHTDASGQEHMCTLPELEGRMSTMDGRWRYEPRQGFVPPAG